MTSSIRKDIALGLCSIASISSCDVCVIQKIKSSKRLVRGWTSKGVLFERVGEFLKGRYPLQRGSPSVIEGSTSKTPE